MKDIVIKCMKDIVSENPLAVNVLITIKTSNINNHFKIPSSQYFPLRRLHEELK